MEEIYSRVKDGTPTDEELEVLGVKIEKNWKKLGRRLGVTESKFLEIGEAHNQLSERAYYMLKHWKQEKGSGATYRTLCGALKHNLVQRQDLAEQFCSVSGPFASQLPSDQVIREVPGASAGVYSGTLAKFQERSSEVKNVLKRKNSYLNPEQGKKCARAFSRYSWNQLQDPVHVQERKKVNRYMKQKIDQVLLHEIFDLSTTVGIRRFCTYLVEELHCFGHLNVVAEECLTTEKVQEELGMETMLDKDYVACKLSSMEIAETASVATSLTTASTIPSTVMAAAAEAVGVPAPAVESGHEQSFFARPQSFLHFAKAHGPSEIPITVATAADVDDKGGIEQLTAHPTQGVGGPCPPKRPGYGTVGRPIRLRANFFFLNISSQLSDLYHYDVEITPNKCPGTVKRDIVNEIIKSYKDKVFQGHCPAFDGKKNLYSRNKPLPAEFSVKLPGEDGRKDREFKVKIQFAASVRLLDQLASCDEQNGKVPQDAVQALDVIMREVPSLHYPPVGRSFFPFDGQRRPLGEGCELQFGFYSNVRHSEWKAMLVNIDVSAKGFYKKQNVIDFICETLGQGVTPQSLEDRNFWLDKHRLEKAICGIRMETTHEASIKRQYTARGVSSISAEKLQFEVEDRATGCKSKTTVAMYFENKYKLHLRYPHLPCLRVGQKKGGYLPMEVCTIIPCQKRHLSEEQTAKILRQAARPAPERQQAIQNWAQEMIQTNSKYLREEFQTSVSPEMVRADGRVLPAPKIKLGPQDQTLVPQNGSWNMHNKMLHEGVGISTWALACFASRCSKDQLRNFCNQMAHVSSQEGMQMTEQPAAMEYPRGFCDVESLFSKWVADYPQLQLIIAVLPDKDKELYPEIKRVGDNVLGIATQCVQIKQAQQAKPLVCANLSLKINSKLGGVNHVIEPSERPPAFREPVIIFGANVAHPCPAGNGIPSIAAVVASMDANATKYSARVRVQRHEKPGGAQELINDLAVMVKELLIEYYKANRGLKPSKIIFYRNGVSESQFGQVLIHEVGAVQQACIMVEKEYRPRITFVVVQKCHHTRLFCEDRQDASGRAQNVPPGTIVDSSITHPYEFDFYLCSHFGFQGTSRPTHYHVLYDDNAFTGDDIQQLTYQLCHLNARCTRSVSIPAPAYYAHLVAFRAKHHVTNGRSGDTVDLERSARAIQVSDRMKGAMYFT